MVSCKGRGESVLEGDYSGRRKRGGEWLCDEGDGAYDSEAEGGRGTDRRDGSHRHAENSEKGSGCVLKLS
jgi:hypothetical protein